MNPIDILAHDYDPQSRAFEILVVHGRQVARKALRAAQKVCGLKPDLAFIETAAMLHDIGILETRSPGFGCYGKHPYICHGVLGGELLKIRNILNWRWSANGTLASGSARTMSGSSACRCPRAI